jgi:hypothetical protein
MRPEIRSPLPYSPKFGCAIGIVALIMGALLATYFIHTGMEQNRQINRFASEDRAPLNKVYSNPERISELSAGLKHFETEIRAGREASLTLSAQDLNDWIGHEDRLFELRDIVVFTEITDVLEARVSMPMRRFPPWKPYRWLNGTMRFRPTIRDGVLVLDIVSLDSERGPVPDGFLAFLRKNGDFLIPYRNDKDLGPVFNTIDRVELEPGEIRVHSTGIRPKKR